MTIRELLKIDFPELYSKMADCKSIAEAEDKGKITSHEAYTISRIIMAKLYEDLRVKFK